MVVVNENKPDDIREIMKQDGFDSSVNEGFDFCCSVVGHNGCAAADLSTCVHPLGGQDSPCWSREAVHPQVCTVAIESERGAINIKKKRQKSNARRNRGKRERAKPPARNNNLVQGA
jgi:hypothetical protein